MKKASVLLLAIALAAFGLAACGGDDDGDDTSASEETTATTETAAAGGGAATISISAAANGDLAYDQTDVQATAGNDTLEFDNPASLPHDVVIEDEGGNEVAATDLITESSTSTPVKLSKGTYTFFCSVPGHREGGMEGTLTVN